MHSRSATERAMGPATTRIAWKPGFGSATARTQRLKESKKVGQPVSQTSCGRPTMSKNAPTVSVNDTRPGHGLRAKRPQYPDGMRTLPPRSEPTPITTPSAARSAQSPPEEPPGVCAADHGLDVRPQSGFSLSAADSACGTFVFPMMMAPAARSVTTIYLIGGETTDGNDRMVSYWEVGKVNVRRRRAQLDRSPTACIRSCCRNL